MMTRIWEQQGMVYTEAPMVRPMVYTDVRDKHVFGCASWLHQRFPRSASWRVLTMRRSAGRCGGPARA